MTIVRTAIGVTPYAVTATAGPHTLILDEPASRGGQGAGFEPYEAVLAGLGACSAITLRMYAERKQLTIRSLSIDLSFHREGDRGVIRRVVHLDADLTPEQRARFCRHHRAHTRHTDDQGRQRDQNGVQGAGRKKRVKLSTAASMLRC